MLGGEDEILLEICGNLSEKRKFSGNFGYIITKIWAILKYNFIEILIKFLRKLSEKFVKVSGKPSGMNFIKILRKFLGKFRLILDEIYRKLDIDFD